MSSRPPSQPLSSTSRAGSKAPVPKPAATAAAPVRTTPAPDHGAAITALLDKQSLVVAQVDKTADNMASSVAQLTSTVARLDDHECNWQAFTGQLRDVVESLEVHKQLAIVTSTLAEAQRAIAERDAQLAAALAAHAAAEQATALRLSEMQSAHDDALRDAQTTLAQQVDAFREQQAAATAELEDFARERTDLIDRCRRESVAAVEAQQRVADLEAVVDSLKNQVKMRHDEEEALSKRITSTEAELEQAQHRIHALLAAARARESEQRLAAQVAETGACSNSFAVDLDVNGQPAQVGSKRVRSLAEARAQAKANAGGGGATPNTPEGSTLQDLDEFASRMRNWRPNQP